MQSLIGRLVAGTLLLRHEPGGGGESQPPSQEQRQPEPQQQTAQRPDDQRIPYDRFREVNEQRVQAEQARVAVERERDELRQRIEQAERQGMTEAQRLQADIEAANRRAEQLERRLAESDAAREADRRSGWIEAAAAAARFHRPEVALRALSDEDLRGIQSRADADRVVGQLAEREAWMVAPDPEEVRRQETERAEQQRQQEAAQRRHQSPGEIVQQILDRGEPVGDRNDDRQRQNDSVIPADEFNALTIEQQVALMERDPDLYHRSLSAAARA